MTRRPRLARFAPVLLPLAALLLVAANLTAADRPADLIRRANAAVRAGVEAEEHARDPGLVAFNRAVALFERKQYRDAERQYDCVLDDAACPPARAARAWYNRGTCLLHRGATISDARPAVDVFRAAIACFENAQDNPAADAEVRDRAPHNLELAKLLWNERRKELPDPEAENPNKRPPAEEKKPQRPDEQKKDGGTDPDNTTGDPTAGDPAPKLVVQPQPQPKDGPDPGGRNVAGNNPTLQVLIDTDQVQQLNPADARMILRESAARRKRELRSLLESLYGPDRPGVRDW